MFTPSFLSRTWPISSHFCFFFVGINFFCTSLIQNFTSEQLLAREMWTKIQITVTKYADDLKIFSTKGKYLKDGTLEFNEMMWKKQR